MALLALLGLLLAPLLGAAPPTAWADDAPAPVAPAKEAAPKATDPLLIGTYPISVECVTDADTIRLLESKDRVRIMAIDAEEVFHRDEDRAAAAKDFAAYAKAKRGARPLPVKYGTPAGDAAREHAKLLMKGATTMRLERDAVDAPAKGYYGRILAHVIILKADGAELNLAEELIRSGHSPYFTKYGRSLRFDARMRQAQDEARKAKRGIWGSDGPDHYPDYDERLRWWDGRADQIDRWRKECKQPNRVTLGSPTADAKLAALVGKEAVVFGLYERELKVSSGDRRLFLLGHKRGRGFPLVVFDDEVVKGLDMDALGARYATARGKVTLHKGRPQMVIESPTQVSTK